MRKQNSINYETSLGLFDANAGTEDRGSYFKINGGESPLVINIPTSIMHRLYRVGQAYNARQLRYFESDVKIIIGNVELPEFVKDLNVLLSLVNDDVLHVYVNKLLDALTLKTGLKGKSIAVSTGCYFG